MDLRKWKESPFDILINNAGGLAGELAKSFAGSVSEEGLKATLDRNLLAGLGESGSAFLYCLYVVDPAFGQ